jgi:uncharacterized protein (TIGR02217 family)
MTSFHDVRFPDDIAYGSSGGPEYATDIVMTDAGFEKRNIAWSQARARYNVAHGIKTAVQLDILIAFFRARKGRAYGFRFKDWLDYRLNNQLLGEGDGATTDFALVKHYASGDVTETRPITRPVLASLQIFKNGVQQLSGVSIIVGEGIVRFSSPPSAGVEVRVTGEFDVPVRFDTDRLSATQDAYGVHSWLDIPLVEIRE